MVKMHVWSHNVFSTSVQPSEGHLLRPRFPVSCSFPVATIPPLWVASVGAGVSFSQQVNNKNDNANGSIATGAAFPSSSPIVEKGKLEPKAGACFIFLLLGLV